LGLPEWAARLNRDRLELISAAMLLSTRCPHCATVFEVVPAQLQRRGGWVRCGECGTVFDAQACRVDVGSFPPEATLSSDATVAAYAATPPAVLRCRAPQRRDVRHASAHDGKHDNDGEADRGQPVPSIIAEAHPYARPRAIPEFLDEDVDTHRRRARWLWGGAALLASLALLLQTLVVFRVTVVTAAPRLRPALETLCRPLACVVGYERRAEHLAITATSLQSIDTGTIVEDASASLSLGVILRNRYQHPQSWPALLLELRDFSDTVVVRRALLADEYVPEAMAAQPLGAGTEVRLSIPLTVTGVRISGYQVSAFYP